MKNIIVFSIIVLAGCASNSGVVLIGQDTYMVSRQAATGFSGSGTLKAEAFEEARMYCVKQNKTLQVVNTNEAQPPYVFGNFPKAEVQFMCLAKNDPELNRPKLRKDAGVAVSVNKDIIENKPDKYSELLKLKELLDANVITQEEFNEQKKKILSQ